MIKKILLLLLFVTCAASAINFRSNYDPDGNYTLAGVPKDKVQLYCSCGPSTSITIPPNATASTGTSAVFSFYDILQQIVSIENDPDCHLSPSLAAHGYYAWDLDKCTFQSTDSTPIIYANVDITAIGDHCMSGLGVGSGDPPICSAYWGAAASWNVQPLSPTADYMTTNAPAATQPATLPCTTSFCEGANCCNQWTGQLYKTETGSVVVTNDTAGMNVACNPSTAAHPYKDAIDFQTEHDAISPSAPDATLTLKCEFTDATTKADVGEITLTNLNGIRQSATTPPGHMWSASVAVTRQSPSGYVFGPVVLATGSDSDTSGAYHTLWTVPLFKNKAGSVAVTGGPASLSVKCVSSTLSHLATTLNDMTIDLQTIHDAVASDESTTVTLECNFHDDASGAEMGQITLTDLNGVRTSAISSPAHIWSTIVTTTQQPNTKAYTLSAAVVAPASDVDTTGQYHNQWTVAFTHNTNNNEVK